jgi:hypothetical protein
LPGRISHHEEESSAIRPSRADIGTTPYPNFSIPRVWGALVDLIVSRRDHGKKPALAALAPRRIAVRYVAGRMGVHRASIIKSIVNCQDWTVRGYVRKTKD